MTAGQSCRDSHSYLCLCWVHLSTLSHDVADIGDRSRATNVISGDVSFTPTHIIMATE